MDVASSLSLIPAQSWSLLLNGMPLSVGCLLASVHQLPVERVEKPYFCVPLYKSADRLEFYWSKVMKFNQCVLSGTD